MPKLLRAVPTLSPGEKDGWRKGEKVKNGLRKREREREREDDWERLRKGRKKRDWKTMISFEM